MRSLTSRAEAQVRGEAECQARKVPWLVLLEARKEYVDWEAFTLWVRAIAEAEQQEPEWLRKVVESRCPGITTENGEKLWKSLDRWKHRTIFVKPNQQGWLRAVSFYAVRDLAYARNWAYWEYCERLWSARRPSSYPSFEEWKSAVGNCADTVIDSSGLRAERKTLVKAARLAGCEQLQQAVESYIELEAIAYWLRPIVEARLPLPSSLAEEFKALCPSIVISAARNWHQLWDVMRRTAFQEAESEGWFEPVVYTAELHPRRVKVVDYWSLYWVDHWPKGKPESYPPFEQWRREAENYLPSERTN